MESATLFWLVMITFGIVLVAAIVDLMALKSGKSGHTTLSPPGPASTYPAQAVR